MHLLTSLIPIICPLNLQMSLVSPLRTLKVYVDNHQLSAKGVERSFALSGYFTSRQEMTSIFAQFPLKAIFAQGVSTTGNVGKSERPIKTIEPLVESIYSAQHEMYVLGPSNPYSTRIFSSL